MVSGYKLGSVAHEMVTDIVKLRKDSTVKEALNILSKRRKKFEMIDYVYVVDNKDKLVGVLSLATLFSHDRNSRLSKIMRTELITISPEAEKEKAAHLALKHRINAVPVVKRGKLIGAVPANKIISILNRSLQKDILHFAGIHKSHLEYEDTMKVPLSLSIMHRIPWLLIGLIGIMLTAALINTFESILEKYLILAFFVPAIVYISGALGTQHQTLFVRDLAILGKEFKFMSYFLRQMLIAAIMGLLLSGITLLVISIFWDQVTVGFVIAASMFIAMILAGFTSMMITLVMTKLGKDPALGSGPFATVISDATSIIIYFIIASWLL